MTNKMDAAAEAVRSILPSPYRLSDGPAECHGVRHRESGGPARFAVVDGLDRQACDLVITYETARDDGVTYDALSSADMPGRLRQAIAEGGTLWVLSGASRSGLGRLRPSFARARRLTVWGGVLLGVGLVLAFFSSHLAALVMGATNLGFAVLAPPPGSPEWEHAVRLRWWSDVFLYAGLVVTGLGIFMQTRGALLALPSDDA